VRSAPSVFTVFSPTMKQTLITLDMEGVLTPEIWIAVAERTGLPELRRTTRDEPDYDKLMCYRLDILGRHGITLSKIHRHPFAFAGSTRIPGCAPRANPGDHSLRHI